LSRRADPAALQPHTCPTCQGEFTANPRIRQVYCSPICRRTSEKQRDRERDQQRARRLGEPVTSPDPVPPGPRAADPLIPTAVRNCPHCDQPVTIVALLATAEAARPTIHQPSSSIIALRRP
jgi:hypothetical protein